MMAGSIADGVSEGFLSRYGYGIDSASNRNEYQGSSLGGGGG
jgi:hypothetical protein